MPMALSGLLQVAKVLHHFRGDDPHAQRVRQHTEQPDIGLFEEELHRIAVHHLDAVHRVEQIAVGIPRFCQEAIVGELDILGHQLAAVEGRLVVPFNALAQMEDISRVVQFFPAFGQIGLDNEGARGHVGADFMPHQFAVDEAHGALRKASDREMGIKVRGIKPAHAQDAAASGLPRLCSPQRGGAMQRPGGQRHASRQASLEQRATTHTLGLMGMLCAHRKPLPCDGLTGCEADK